MKATRKCLDGAASDYIAKPVDIDLLLALLGCGSAGQAGRTPLEPRAFAARVTGATAMGVPLVRPRRAAAESARAILIVDDDERNLLRCPKCSSRWPTWSRHLGPDALRELLKGDFAVILLDVFMPEMDGYETAALVRQRWQTARIPIIFLSAVNKETEHLMRGYAMGAVDYVFKPVDPVVLRSKVAVFVDLFLLRQQVAEQARAEQELREAKLQAESERPRGRARAAALAPAPGGDPRGAAAGDVRGQHRRAAGSEPALRRRRPRTVRRSGRARARRRRAALVRPHRRGRREALEQRLADSYEPMVTSHYRWARSDGSVIHVIDQCVKSAGSASDWVGTLIDVTAQRELEQQLVQSRKSEALGQLTGGVAHDFNNLLAAVLGGLRLLEGRLALGDRERKIVEHMRYAAESGAELVRRLMAFARKQDLTPTSLDPARLRDTVAGLIEHAMGDNVAVEWQVPETSLRLFVDAPQLELALVNLLINARDAMPEGGTAHVTIEQARQPADTGPGEFLRIRVEDEGEGIPSELLERVTEPFFTTKSAGRAPGSACRWSPDLSSSRAARSASTANRDVEHGST
jgi:signal transduction histidine kinase